jgi:hypothetical protein
LSGAAEMLNATKPHQMNCLAAGLSMSAPATNPARPTCHNVLRAAETLGKASGRRMIRIMMRFLLPAALAVALMAGSGNVDVGLNGEVRTRRQKLVQCESDRSHLSLARVLTAIDRSGKVTLSMDQRLWVAQQLAQTLLDLA